MAPRPLTTEQVWELLDQVKDPEIPVVSVVELGLVRQVAVDGSAVRVVMTPTFSGCPALQVMRDQVRQRLEEAGAHPVEVSWKNSPPWTTEWLTPQARQKLKDFGLSPPPRHDGNFEATLQQAASCPYCNSTDTVLKNDFGPTLCRAIFYCLSCQQPFEQFKPL